LIAATTIAFDEGLLARRLDHYRHWTIVGIVLIAVLGGAGGGGVRDVLLNKVPSAPTDPWYLILCVLAAILALRIAFIGSPRFRLLLVFFAEGWRHQGLEGSKHRPHSFQFLLARGEPALAVAHERQRFGRGWYLSVTAPERERLARNSAESELRGRLSGGPLRRNAV